MKDNLFIAALLLSCFTVLFACNNGSSGSRGNAASSDTSVTTLTEANAVMQPLTFRLSDYPAKTFGTSHAFRVIPTPDEVNARNSYMNTPAIRDAAGNPIWGYKLDTGDFAKLIKLKNINNLYFEFGIRDSVLKNNKWVMQYTIMVVPLDSSNNRLEVQAGFSAYDFVCPCVNHNTCCPSN
jgi:hypothetical protein